MYGFSFFLNSILLGIGLAMDAFSVSPADGLAYPAMPQERRRLIAGIFSFFQFAMPMIGWACVSFLVSKLSFFQKLTPWIALGLLGYIGGKMLVEGIRKKSSSEVHQRAESEKERSSFLSAGTLLLQAVATSIDALSVGMTISSYGFTQAFVCAAIIAAVTYALCRGGVALGMKFGAGLADKASILGGSVLIAIGIEIFVRGVFFS